MFDLAHRYCVFDHPKKPGCIRIFVPLSSTKRNVYSGITSQMVFKLEERERCTMGNVGTHFPCFIKSLVSRLLCGGTMGAVILPIQPIIRHFYKPNAHIQVGMLPP